MKDTPAGHSRYEYKYLVPDALVPEIRRHLRAFMQPDAFARHSGGIYPIASVYFDSPDLRLLEMGLRGWSARMKLRARTYSEHSGEPVYLEVKRRSNGIVHKLRARVARAAALAYLRTGTWERGVELVQGPALREFVELALAFSVRPVMRIRYLREAYESRAGNPLRITFDTRLEYGAWLHDEVAMGAGPWRALPMAGTVLEIKFTDVYPTWVRALVARFELERRSISKYSVAMQTPPPERGAARHGARSPQIVV